MASLLPNRFICPVSGLSRPMSVFTEKLSPKICLPSVLNSSSVKISANCFSFLGSIFKSESLHFMGTSVIIVASRLESSACCLLFSTFSFCFPLSSSTWSSKPSTVSYFFKSLGAVFLPMPGIPGILSTLSPHNARTSITCSGLDTFHFSSTSLMPSIS